ncbi:biotin-dependent carboxyltransferase family protein [Candidatus Macondimonas diazotrophica]|nr:biotin-dependent carboxyltransferase family protein [Candidatus Macondimonas diazotrophica]
MIHIDSPGLLTTVQDLGRPGYQQLGLSPGGAMDVDAAHIANLLVGNAPSAAVLEITLTGPRITFEHGHWIALTGADLPGTVAGVRLPGWRPIWVPPGAQLVFGSIRKGCRAYLALAGGIDVPIVLGSRSTDLRAGIGGLHGRRLINGDRLPIGACTRPPPLPDDRPCWPRWWATHEMPTADQRVVLRFVPGPDWKILPEAARRALTSGALQVDHRFDRMGLRLSGIRLSVSDASKRLSAGVTFGTLQLPPDGQPILLGADRQTTGGYPVLGTVARVDHARLAQLRADDRLYFSPLPVAAAQTLYRARARDIARLAIAIELSTDGAETG